MKHYNITISGRVQGVGFRYYARSVARYMSISGFVRNLPNNNVYIEAEGDDKQLDEFVNWCRNGPDNARVNNVSIISGDVKKFEGFEIRF